MTAFFGEHICKLDSKGRVLFPVKYLREMPRENGNLLICKKHIFENCLVLYPYPEWQKQSEQLRKQLNPFNRKHEKIRLLFYKNMAELYLDNQNRLSLPKRLLEEVGITKEIVLAGHEKEIQIWAKDVYFNDQGDADELADLIETELGDIPWNKPDIAKE